MRRPRTLMWSRAGSAFVPGSRTTSPLTVTSPASIISSACRRLASPAAAINFCRRSSINSSLKLAAAREVFEVFDVRQLAQVFEAELEEEVFRRAVHHRAADRLFA